MRSTTRTAAAVLGLVLTASLTTGCSTSDEPTRNTAADTTAFPSGSTMDKIRKRGRLIVGVKYDQPAFGLLNPLTGQPEGFDIEIARLIAKNLTGSKKNITFVETVTANREAFLQQGKVDLVLASYVVNDKRKKQVAFAGPYFDTGISIMTRKGDRSIRKTADLNGRPVCVAQGSTSADVLPHLAPRAELREFSAYSYCAQALKDHRVDAMVTSESILIGLEQQNPDELAVLPGHLEPEEVAVGLPKGDRALHRHLDAFLDKIAEDGRWRQAYRDTVGKVTHTSPSPPQTTL
ncbi:glutamate ABC transporter substrate-binding protein [Streptomyces sp. NPDC005356]|uniref:glutamate ABC transporter substrate-binding protein n=1 Tax=unclassified Streptomyces TaxID=2593676 RepID=UPI0033B74682